VSRTDTAALADRYRSYPGSGEHAAVAVLLTYEPVAAAAKFARHAGSRGVDWDRRSRRRGARGSGCWSQRRPGCGAGGERRSTSAGPPSSMTRSTGCGRRCSLPTGAGRVPEAPHEGSGGNGS
jgi:hypothetical protein